MTRLRAIFDQLRAHADTSVDLALASSLPTADADACRLIVPLLLERGRTRGKLGLVQQFHRMPEDMKELLLTRVDDLYPALRLSCADGNQPQGQRNTIAMIRDARCAKLTYLISEAISFADDAIRAEAANCLLELAQWARNRSSDLLEDMEQSGMIDGTWVEDVAAGVAESVRHYSRHKQLTVLEALVAMSPRDIPALRPVLEDARSAAVPPLQRMLEAANHPHVRHSLLAWLRYGTLHKSACRGIQAAAAEQSLADVVELSHLLIAPQLRAKLSELPERTDLQPTAPAVERYPVSAMRQLPAWIMALPTEDPQRVQVLETYRTLNDPASRLAALRRLITCADRSTDDAADSVIATYCEDAEAPIARIALHHLLRRQWAGRTKLLLTLIESPHPRVRSLASSHLSTLAFDRVWSAWPKLDEARQLAAGRALIKLDPNFHRLLAERLAKDDRQNRLRVLSMIHVLNQGHVFEPALVVLAKHPDDIIASAAVRALGGIDPKQARQPITEALLHHDSRVRANAVEALEQIDDSPNLDALRQMADADNNRPRANAIKVLLKHHPDEALAALTRMVHDPRPEHRLSALWLIDHLELVELSQHVAEMSVSDPQADVRRQATEVIHELIHALRETTPGIAATPREPADAAPPTTNATPATESPLSQISKPRPDSVNHNAARRIVKKVSP